MLRWPRARWAAAVAAAVIAMLVTGVPTGMVSTQFYSRMTPIRWWDYPLWIISSALMGLLVATYTRTTGEDPVRRLTTRLLGGGVLSTFAIGCPVCNKLVVAAIGVSGALDYWAPLQPSLGMLSIALLVLALRGRLRAACRVRSPAKAGPQSF